MMKSLSLVALLACAASAAQVEVGDVGAALKNVGRQSGATRIHDSKWTRHLHWLGGKARVELAPGATESGLLKLSSTEVVEECDFNPRTGQRCWQTFGRTERRTVKLVLVGRPVANPTETFDVWLMGRDLSVDVIHSPTKYDVEFKGGTIVLTAKH